MTLAESVRITGLETQQSRIDLYAESADQTLVVEVKSIHAGNFRRQTRAAVGQLFEYSYFDIPDDRKDSTVMKALAYSQEPPDEIINYLRGLGIEILWVEDGVVKGHPGSLDRLRLFLNF